MKTIIERACAIITRRGGASDATTLRGLLRAARREPRRFVRQLDQTPPPARWWRTSPPRILDPRAGGRFRRAWWAAHPQEAAARRVAADGRYRGAILRGLRREAAALVALDAVDLVRVESARAELQHRASVLGLADRVAVPPPAGEILAGLPETLAGLPAACRPALGSPGISYRVVPGRTSQVLADIPGRSEMSSRGRWRTVEHADRRVQVRAVGAISGDRAILAIGAGEPTILTAPAGAEWVLEAGRLSLREPGRQREISPLARSLAEPAVRVRTARLSLPGRVAILSTDPRSRLWTPALRDAPVHGRLDLARCPICGIRVAGVSPLGEPPVLAHQCAECGLYLHSECAQDVQGCPRYACRGMPVPMVWVSRERSPLWVAQREYAR